MGTSNCGRAVVIGGSIAGLFCARALATTYEQVDLFERDVFPDGPDARKGVPQGRHVHGLLVRGGDLAEAFFPGITQELERDGADILDFGRDVRWYHYGGWHTPTEVALRPVFCSRPFLEFHIRRRLAALPNVRLRDGYAATGLRVDHEQHVNGVRVNAGAGVQETLDADLVVDASGRGSMTPKWLTELGFTPPREEVLGADVYYATRCYRRPAAQPKRAWLVYPEPPSKIGGFVFPIEGERWTVTLFSLVDDRPPADPEEWLAFARRLPDGELFETFSAAEPLSDIVLHHTPPNRRRYYEQLRDLPEGLVVTGDAVAAFNPTFGQGMSVGAMDAEALQDEIDRGGTGPGFCARATRAIAQVVDNPWAIVTAEDLRFDGVEGQRSVGIRLTQWYMARVLRASNRDPKVYAAFLEVMNFKAPLTRLFQPGVAARALLG